MPKHRIKVYISMRSGKVTTLGVPKELLERLKREARPKLIEMVLTPFNPPPSPSR